MARRETEQPDLRHFFDEPLAEFEAVLEEIANQIAAHTVRDYLAGNTDVQLIEYAGHCGRLIDDLRNVQKNILIAAGLRALKRETETAVLNA